MTRAKPCSFLGVVVAMTIGACDKPQSTRLDEAPLPHVRAAEVRWVQPRPQSRHLVPLVAYREARLSPRSGGQVTALHVDEEQQVEAGDELVRFAADDPRGGLISARAGMSRLKESLRDTERQLEDARSLVKAGAGTTREVEALETQQATLLAQLREARGSLVRAKDRVGAAAIEAPFAGTATRVDTEVGEFVAPGVVAIVLSQLDPIAIEVPLTQEEAELSDVGGLTFSVKARGGEREAELEWISSAAADRTATFVARLKMANPDRRLRSGELVDVEVFGAAQDRVMAVPFTAVRWAADQSYVLRIADTHLERVDVEVRDEADDLVVIEGDVTVGDKVVSAGPIALRQGDEVAVVDTKAEAIAAR
jgi:multidrug efflux system membrane fusion protein